MYCNPYDIGERGNEIIVVMCVFSRVGVLLLVCHLGAGGAKENTVISFPPSGPPPPFCQRQTGRLSQTPPKARRPTQHTIPYLSMYSQPNDKRQTDRGNNTCIVHLCACGKLWGSFCGPTPNLSRHFQASTRIQTTLYSAH